MLAMTVKFVVMPLVIARSGLVPSAQGIRMEDVRPGILSWQTT